MNIASPARLQIDTIGSWRLQAQALMLVNCPEFGVSGPVHGASRVPDCDNVH
jgi:hypothetical protein